MRFSFLSILAAVVLSHVLSAQTASYDHSAQTASYSYFGNDYPGWCVQVALTAVTQPKIGTSFVVRIQASNCEDGRAWYFLLTGASNTSWNVVLGPIDTGDRYISDSDLIDHLTTRRPEWYDGGGLKLNHFGGQE